MPSARSQDESARARAPHRKNARGQGAQLREDLLAAAIDILEGGGTEADLSIRAVTKRVGVTPTAFYLRFADREELLWAVYAREFDELEEALQGAASAELTPAGRLRARTQAYGRYAEQHPAKYRVLFGILSTYTAAADAGTLPSDTSFSAWRDVISQCRAAGQSRDDEPQLLTITLLGAIHGLALLRLNKPGRPWPPLADLYDDVLQHQIGLPPP